SVYKTARPLARGPRRFIRRPWYGIETTQNDIDKISKICYSFYKKEQKTCALPVARVFCLCVRTRNAPGRVCANTCERERKKKQMNKITRKGFLKIAAAAAMSGVTAGALAACESASSAVSGAASAGSAPAAGAAYIPGTYEGTAQGISSTVKVTMTFSETAVTDVVVDTSGETASYGAAAADELRQQLLEAGSAEIDGVSGSTITS